MDITVRWRTNKPIMIGLDSLCTQSGDVEDFVILQVIQVYNL